MRPVSRSPKKRTGSPLSSPKKRSTTKEPLVQPIPLAFQPKQTVPPITASTEEWENKAAEIQTLAKTRNFSPDWIKFLEMFQDKIGKFGRENPLERTPEDYECIENYSGVVRSYMKRVTENDATVRITYDLAREIKEPKFLARYGDYLKLVLNRVQGNAIMAAKPKKKFAGAVTPGLSGLQEGKEQLWDTPEMKEYFQKHAQWTRWREVYKLEVKDWLTGPTKLYPDFQRTVAITAVNLGVTGDDLLSWIDTYADRNVRFHNDIERLLKESRFAELALHIAKDLAEIRDDFPDDWPNARRESMVKAVNTVKDTYFTSLDPDGQGYVLSAEGRAMREEHLRKLNARQASGST